MRLELPEVLTWPSCLALCAVTAVCWPCVCCCPTVLVSRGGKGKACAVLALSSQALGGLWGREFVIKTLVVLNCKHRRFLGPMDTFCSTVTDHSLLTGGIYRVTTLRRQLVGPRSPRQPQVDTDTRTLLSKYPPIHRWSRASKAQGWHCHGR